MEPIVVGLAMVAVVVLTLPEPIPERIRPSAILAAGLIGGASVAWVAWTHRAWPPALLAIALPVAAAFSYRYQWGPRARREQRDAAASLLGSITGPIRGEARLLTGWTVLGSQRGWLELTGSRLRFVLEDGDVVFDVDVRHESELSLALWRRGQLRLKHEGAKHKLMFGHRAWMDLDEQRRAVEFWRFAISRRAAGG